MNEKQLERDEAHIEALKDARVAEARAGVPAPGTVGPEFCPLCDDDIPDGRRQAGYQHCVNCAAAAERRAGLRR
jgi:hypothetical protein